MVIAFSGRYRKSLRSSLAMPSLGHILWDQAQRGHRTDLEIVMGEAGSILQAHQNVVAGRSPVWDAMLNHDMRARTAKLTLADVDERFFKP